MPSLLLSESRYPRGLSHRVPLLLPGILGVWGATYPACALKIAVSAGLIGLLALAARRVALATRGDDVRGTSHAGPIAIARAPLILSVVCLFLGIWRGYLWETRIRVVAEHAAPAVHVEMTVIPVQEPEPLPHGSRYSFRAIAKSSAAPHAGWFGVLASCYPSHLARLTPGSSVECRAVLELPSPAMNPGGFDYRGHLLGDRVVVFAEIEDVVGPGRMRPSPLSVAWVKASAALRTSVTRALQSTLPAGDAAVLKAVFLGDRSDLLPEDTRNFKRSGFYRFVGISGFHVDLLFLLTEKSLRQLTKRPSFSRAVALLSAYCYGSLSGWSAGALRAVVSGSMRVLAPAVRRKYHPLAGLGASAIAIMWAVPFPLMNTGFLLSFAGAAGAWLGWVYAEALSAAAPAYRWAVSPVRPVTLCLVLFPVMALCFTEVSLVSFALGGIWGSIAALMVPVAALTSFIPPLGTIFGWVPHILLEGTRALSGLLSSVPVAGMTVPSPGLHEIAAYWALLALPLTVVVSTGAVRGGEEASAFFRRRRALSALRRVVLMSSAAVLLISAILRVYAPVPEVTFLFVGQGDCAVVRHGSAVMMVDTGTAAAFDSHVLPYLRARGVNRIDLCVISHLHADHAGGLAALCAEVTVGLVAVTPGFRGQAKTLIEEGVRVPGRTVSEGRVPPVIELNPGLRYRWGGAVLEVIAPEPESFGPGDPTNESSVGFILNLGRLEVEFWGDSPSSSIAAAMDAYGQALEPAPGDPPRLVKVPHHGSADAYVPALYERIGKAAATEIGMISIISVGANPYGHPSNRVEEAARRGGRLFRTDEAGAVTVRAAFGGALVRTFLP